MDSILFAEKNIDNIIYEYIIRNDIVYNISVNLFIYLRGYESAKRSVMK
jgi:hypothetical protein